MHHFHGMWGCTTALHVLVKHQAGNIGWTSSGTDAFAICMQPMLVVRHYNACLQDFDASMNCYA